MTPYPGLEPFTLDATPSGTPRKKKASGKSPTARSLDHLRKNGWTCQVVERRVPYTHITQDLFGCLDVLAIKPGMPITGVQVTSSGNLAARRAKVLGLREAALWLNVGGAIMLHGWAKRGPANTRKVWSLTAEAIRLEQFQ